MSKTKLKIGDIVWTKLLGLYYNNWSAGFIEGWDEEQKKYLVRLFHNNRAIYRGPSKLKKRLPKNSVSPVT